MPPSLPPQPPQVATVQVPAEQPAASHFRDLTSAQRRWLDILEQHGIVRTDPQAHWFGPEQPVRRDELLMSESRLLELLLKREEEQRERLTRLEAELERLRSNLQAAAQTPVAPAVAREAIHGPVLATRGDVLPGKAPIGEGSSALPARGDAKQTPDPEADLDLAVLRRHAHRLPQFPRLQRFLQRIARLDAHAPEYREYMRTYLATAGLTEGLLREASRQAAWLEAGEAG